MLRLVNRGQYLRVYENCRLLVITHSKRQILQRMPIDFSFILAACLPRGQCVLLMPLFFHIFSGRTSYYVMLKSSTPIFTNFSGGASLSVHSF